MKTTQAAQSGRIFLPLLGASTCLMLAAALTGCGAPATPPASQAAHQEQRYDQAQAEPTLEEREAAVQQREAEVAARENAAPTQPQARPAQPAPAARHQGGSVQSHGSAPSSASGSASSSASASGSTPSHAVASDGAAPTAQRRAVEIPAGTQLQVELQGDVSSGTSTAGQEIAGRLTADVVVDGTVVLPAGSTVSGTVTQAVPRKKIGGTAQISLNFDHVTLASGERVAISAPFTAMAKSETGKDAATIGGAAVAGAILGHQIGNKNGKVVGAILGGAAGTAVAAKTGHDLELPTGTVLAVPLDQSASVTVR